jgi:DNA repair protein RAD16
MPRKSKATIEAEAREAEAEAENENENENDVAKETIKESETSHKKVHMPFIDEKIVEEEPVPVYVVEISKSARALCKRCDEKIMGKVVRVGTIVDGNWGLFTSWLHLDCMVFHKSIEDASLIDGYQELPKESQQLLADRIIKSADEEDEDLKPMDPDEMVRKTWTQPKEPSSDLLMPLLPYQKEGLGWMSNQEFSDMHGGILADEMGMGKTIQAIALILDNRPNAKDLKQLEMWDDSDMRHGADPKKSIRAGTLIILPTIALRQWQMEVSRFTKEGTLTVKVYHGTNRSTTIKDLKSADIVLTSYAIMETEYRKATAGTKVTCRLCNKKFYPDKLRVHRKYFCGEGAKLSEAQGKTQRKGPRQVSEKTMQKFIYR